MDQGERWMLGDVVRNPIRGWDGRGHRLHTEYDPLRRVLRIRVADADDPDALILVERRVYGEQHPDAAAHNLRGELYLVLDQSGASGNEDFDFKGNVLRVSRRVTRDYSGVLGWTEADAALTEMAQFDPAALAAAVEAHVDDEDFRGRTRYDALNRPIAITTADGSRIRHHYNRSRLLDRIELNSGGAREGGRRIWTPIVTRIDYDARGKRTRVDRGNGSSTRNHYDPITARVRRTLTVRGQDGQRRRRLQDLRYVYDPIGNVAHVGDDAQQRIFFRNRRVEPSTSYVYDATYQLVRATGREHLGQTGGSPIPHSPRDDARVGLPQPGDGAAMATYVESYDYDAAGNLLAMHHRGSVPGHDGWTREYDYDAASQLEPDRTGNRLGRSRLAGDLAVDVYPYDSHGNLTRLPHLGGGTGEANLAWSFRDHLVRADLADGAAHYVYDAEGQRIRKVVEHRSGRREERLYLGALEVFRRRRADGSVSLERVTLNVTDEQVRHAQVETRTVGTDDDAPAQLVRHQFGNHLNSVTLELDGAARVVTYEEYSPYGSTTYQAVRRGTETPKRYRFTALERDEETGLEYHSARYYAPWLARWTAAEPIGLDGGTNVYRYVSGNPVSAVDPFGLGFWGHVWGGVKTVGGALETAAGVALVGVGAATSEIGIGIPIIAAGVFVTAHGADTTVSGARQLVTGEHADTLTATGLQAAGLSKRNANLVDAGISVVGTLGASAVTKAPTIAVAATDAAADAALVHRTTSAGAAAIAESSTLGKGASTVYAGPASLADASGLGITLRTGLTPAKGAAVVTIPSSAASAFRVPAVVGPFTAWQRGFGTVYTAGAGSINLTTGAFTRTGPAWNQIGLYAVDTVANAGLRVAGESTSIGPTVQQGAGDPLSLESATGTDLVDPSGATWGDASSTDPSLQSYLADPLDMTQEEIDAQACLLPEPL